MSKAKITALVMLSGSFVMALGLNCLPNIGSTLDLSNVLGLNLTSLTGLLG